MNGVVSKGQVVSELMDYFTEVLSKAPKYGWCGLSITFHDGRPVKVEKNIGISIKSNSGEKEG
jgi:hypothetical protein